MSAVQPSPPAEARERAVRQGSSQARVFFALWPDPEIQAALAQHGGALQRRMGGKPTRQESIHLTLAFLGDIDLDRMDDVRAIGARAAFQPFAFTIDTAGCWGHNGVAWLGPRATPAPLLSLVGSLEAALLDAGFRVEQRRYAAHVTVVRKARCRPIDLALAPIEWRVEQFVLVRSELNVEGSRYTAIGRWPAAGREPG
ncbi:MAG TPA: RNA 2',3'-cyclic phosphodiesterase [Burkholderiales bacterium]|nr:RNA 2',3'-cyclic phosphodiesterase [Burkholderiales bacterium]